MFVSLLDCIEEDKGLLVWEMTLKFEALAAFIGVVALLVDGKETFPVSSPIFLSREGGVLIRAKIIATRETFYNKFFRKH